MPPVELNDTTFEATLVGGDKVEIGDKESTDFKPSIKLNRWGGECFIKVTPANLVEEEEVEYEVEGDKIKVKYKVKQGEFEEEWETEFYPLEPRTVIAKDKEGNDVEFGQCELGGFEFETILKKKPKTNKIVLNIETQGLKAYPQPYEIPEDSIAPDNVKGSIVFYHATKTPFHKSKEEAEKYKACKAFTLYRSKSTDAVGNWRWNRFEWNQQAGKLDTIIDQDFLDIAVYPVSTGTTNFGNESSGSYNQITLDNYLEGAVATCPADGIAISLTLSLVTTSSTFDGLVKAVLVLHDDLSIVDDGIGSVITVPKTAIAWYTSTFSTPPTLINATDYLLSGVFWTDGRTYELKVRYDSVAEGHEDKTNNYASPIDPTDAQHLANKLFSIYCTYEEPGPEPIDYPIGLSVGLTASAIVAYKAEWDRAIAPGLTASVTIVKFYGWLVATIADLAISATVARKVAYKRASSSGLTTAVTILKGWGRAIATTANLAASVTVLKGWGRIIATTSNLTVSVTVSKVKGFVKAVVSNLTASTVITRAVAWTRHVPLRILYEYYITSPSGQSSAWDTKWISQTFTPSSNHTIRGVNLLLKRTGLPGYGDISIRATDGGHPILPDLCSGTIDGDTLTTDSAGKWYTITFGDGASLVSGIKYAIVVRAIGAAAFNYFQWKDFGATSTYPGGNSQVSLDSGGTWTDYLGWDSIFQEWGADTLGLGLATTVSRVVKWDRATQAGLTLAVTILKGWGRKITTLPGLTVAVTIVATFVGITHYLITVVTNLTASATILKGWGRTIATTTDIAVAVSILKGWGRTIATSTGLTISATVAYKAAWDRSIDTGLTATVSVLKGWGRTITTTADLTVGVTLSRAMAYKRASTSGITTAVSILKGWGRAIATTANLTVSATILKGWGRVIDTSTGLTVAVATIGRALAYKRATVSNLTLAITILKGWGRAIATSTDLTINATVSRKVTFTRATTASLTAAVSILKGWGRAIATTADLTLSVTLLKGWGRKITTITGLTVNAVISKLIAYKRATLPGLTVAVTIVATLAGITQYLITVVTNLTVSTTVSKMVAYKRSTQANLSVAVTVVKLRARTIITTANLTINTVISRVVAYNRTIQAGLSIAVSVVRQFSRTIIMSPNLTINVLVNRAVAWNRAISSGLTVAVTVIRVFGATITTAANLVIDVTITRGFGWVITTTANLKISVIVRYCVTLRELLRASIDRLDAQRLAISRMAISRVPTSRKEIWRRIRSCFP